MRALSGTPDRIALMPAALISGPHLARSRCSNCAQSAAILPPRLLDAELHARACLGSTGILSHLGVQHLSHGVRSSLLARKVAIQPAPRKTGNPCSATVLDAGGRIVRLQDAEWLPGSWLPTADLYAHPRHGIDECSPVRP